MTGRYPIRSGLSLVAVEGTAISLLISVIGSPSNWFAFYQFKLHKSFGGRNHHRGPSGLDRSCENVIILKADVDFATQKVHRTTVELEFEQYQKAIFDRLAKSGAVKEELVRRRLHRRRKRCLGRAAQHLDPGPFVGELALPD